MPELNLEERVDEHFRTCYIATLDSVGMMRHILDSMGALRHRIKDQPVPDHHRLVFKSAMTALLDVIIDGENIEDTSAMGLLMDVFPDPKKRGDGRNWLPLHWAAAVDTTSEQHLKAILREQPLVVGHDHSKSIQDVNLEREFMRTHEIVKTSGLLPIHFLCSNRYPRLANVLTLVNANKFTARVADEHGWLPIHWAASNCCDLDIIRTLFEAYPEGMFQPTTSGLLPFHLSTHNKNIEIINYFLEAHPELVATIDNTGNNALHEAARFGNPITAQRLLEVSPDLGLSKNFADQLPLHALFSFLPEHPRIRQRVKDTLLVLLEHHPEAAAMSDGAGRLPLHLAVIYRMEFSCVELIHGVYPSGALQKDYALQLPVHYAEDVRIQQLLMAAPPALAKAGMKSSFAKFSV